MLYLRTGSMKKYKKANKFKNKKCNTQLVTLKRFKIKYKTQLDKIIRRQKSWKTRSKD